MPKSDLYRNALPLLNSCKADLLDLPRLQAQLCGLERRVSRGGRDSIDGGYDSSLAWVSCPTTDRATADREWQ